MATTSIWSVRGWLGKLVIYVENPEKTERPVYKKLPGITDNLAEGLSDVIAYAIREEKTSRRAWENAKNDDLQKENEIRQQFVTGINCSSLTARSEMIAVKKRFGKENGVVAYHGYQSFAPGECTPEVAHEIGIRLAKRLWGDRYQVLVATHLDKENHLHNHFVGAPIRGRVNPLSKRQA